ncbi:hypothetical protein GGI21_006712, partial [Coemansia aciculifera]
MKVLSLFLLLTAAVAQAHDESSSVASPASAAVEDGAVSPSDTVVVLASPEPASDAHAPAEQSGSYEPLFNFDLEPYNMALEIVADALEKLSDTMEPLDLPLPLVGPGYYLEVQVKSPKNAHGNVPFSQINAVTIEGGQAPPVTQVEIILPGESVAHETIMLPADSASAPEALTPAQSVPASTLSSESNAAPSSATQANSLIESASASEPEPETEPSAASPLAPATTAATEAANVALSAASASASNMINNAIEHLYSQGAFDGQVS